MADPEILTRRAPAAKTSLNREARTVDMVMSRFADVQRWDWIEELSRSREDWDFSRVDSPAGVPLLWGHNTWSQGANLGRIVSLRWEAGAIVATAKLSRSPAAERFMQDVEDGLRPAVSFGYAVDRYERVPTDDDEDRRRARGIRVHEVSVVSVAADPGASVRSFPMPTEVEEEITAPPLVPEGRAPANRAGMPIQERREFIRRLTRSHHLEEDHPEDFDDLVKRTRGKSEQEVRYALMDTLVDVQERTRSPRMKQADIDWRRQMGYDDGTQQRGEVVTAIGALLGAPPKADDPTGLVGRSVLEIGRHYLESAGTETRGLRDSQIAGMLVQPQRGFLSRAYHTTSDFPLLLVEGAQRAALERYKAVPSVLERHSRKKNQKDFRPTTFVRPGEAPELLKVNQHGEIESGTLSLESEVFQLASWGRSIGFTFQALANDDLGMFDDLIGAFVDSSTNRVGDEFFALLSENGFGGKKTKDGKNFFHADHGNLAGAGGVISVETIGAAEIAMRGQKNVSGKGPAGIAPTTILVGPARAVAARKFVTEINATTTSEVNPYAGKLTVEVEDRYTGNGWWLFGSRPAFVHGYLDGHPEGPIVETKEGWSILGTEYRAVMHFAANVFDYRAAYFNPGQ